MMIKRQTGDKIIFLSTIVIKLGILFALVFLLPGWIDESIATRGEARTICALLNGVLVLFYLTFVNLVDFKNSFNYNKNFS